MIRVEHIDHVAIAVADIVRSEVWYRDVLGLERRFEEVWDGPPVMMCAGDTCVALFPTETDEPEPAPGRNAIAMRHVAFVVDRANFERAQAELPAEGVELRFADHGVSHSVYLADPDGHEIELTTYDLG